MAKKKRFPGNLERRAQSWRARFCIDGKRHYFSIDTLDRKEAEDAALAEYERLQKQQDRIAAGLPGPTRFSTVADKFERDRVSLLAPNTRKTYEDSLTAFRAFFVKRLEDPTVDRIRQGHVADFLTWRRSRPLKGDRMLGPRTVAKDRAVLHALFAYAEELELRDGNPVSKVKPPKSDARKPVILEAEQYEKLMDACEDPMLRLYVLALGETGARCDSEVLWLRWSDVQLEEGFILIDTGSNGHRTKSGKARWVPMTPRLRQAMREHVLRFRGAQYVTGTSKWVFHHTRKRRHAKAGERIRNFRRGFQNAAERAKLPAELHQHDLRHRRVTTWLAEGRDVVHVKEAVGHADLRTTMGYTHLAKEHLRSLVEPITKSDAAKKSG
jgi:site-specific recombinase XerD